MIQRPLPRAAHLLLVAAVCALAVVVLRPRDDAPSVSGWRPSGGASIAGDAAPVPAPAAAVALALQVDPGLYDAERAELDGDVRRALGYVSERFGGQLSAAVTAAFIGEAGCGLSGIAYTDVRVVQVYSCPSIARDRAVAIMAHEFVHQLQQDRYGARHLSADLILSEGMATWGAGSYWLGGHPDFRSYVRAQRDAGTLYPLATHYSGLGIGAMNALYYQWASFVEFLVQTYGREKLDQLYVSGAGAPGSADYAGVYGKGLDALEQEWLAWLDS
jgi:hypothetical protein